MLVRGSLHAESTATARARRVAVVLSPEVEVCLPDGCAQTVVVRERDVGAVVFSPGEVIAVVDDAVVVEVAGDRRYEWFDQQPAAAGELGGFVLGAEPIAPQVPVSWKAPSTNNAAIVSGVLVGKLRFSVAPGPTSTPPQSGKNVLLTLNVPANTVVAPV